jgi:hypothetical protein
MCTDEFHKRDLPPEIECHNEPMISARNLESDTLAI